ncbi:MAG: hypothetical protein AAGL34_08340 [Bacteroidota bacterium]
MKIASEFIKEQYKKDIHYVAVDDSIYDEMRKLVNKELGNLLE